MFELVWGTKLARTERQREKYFLEIKHQPTEYKHKTQD